MPSITIPMTIPSQNVRDRWHWRRRHKDLNQWYSYIMALKPKGDSPFRKKRRVTITSVRVRRITDDANLRGGAKGLVDALVSAGVLVDDSDDWCKIEYKQRTLGSAGNKPCTIIEWEDIASNE